MIPFLLLKRSENQPEKSFKKLEMLSAMPSIIPTKTSPAPKTWVRKRGMRG
jgi:hypothetical protein